jgi:ATP-dependent helicase/nuclease subunit A
MSEWTPAQGRAVYDTERSMVVAAGAGSGKTRVLVGRYIHLLESGLADLDEIIAITFTEKAATEMKGRVWSAIVQRQADAEARGEDSGRWRDLSRRLAGQARISTIHSFCARLIRDYPLEAGVDPHFTVLEPLDAGRLVSQASMEAIDDLIRSGDRNMQRLIADFGVSSVAGGVAQVYEKARATGRPFHEFAQISVGNIRRCAEIARQSLAGEWGDIVAALVSAGVDEDVLGALDWDSPRLIEEFLELHSTARPVRKVVTQTELNKIAERVRETASNFVYADMMAATVDTIVRACELLDAEYLRLRGDGAAIDFTGLELAARNLLRDTDAGERVRRQIKFVMVDEYQDTNSLQNEIVMLLVGDPPGNRLFIVGDVKQSIYGFRGAEVEVFRGAMDRARGSGGRAGLENLGKNFRSIDPLVELTNTVFSGTLQEIWSEDAAAFRGMPETSPPRTELHVVTHGKSELAPASLAEADLVASRIARMVECGEQLVCEHDRKTGELVGTRPVRYKDIAILLRTTSRLENFEAALDRKNVPYYVVDGRGFYGRPEVAWIINMLRAVDDPFDDAALAAVLRHPVFGLSDESLLRLALAGGLAQAFPEVAAASDKWGAEEGAKLARAQECMGSLRQLAGRLSPDQMIQEILEATWFEPYLALTADGPKAIGNVAKLADMAREASRSALAIREFIEMIELAATDNAREAEAALVEEEADVVTIMTVHKSKGLEFPVVIVPELNRATGRRNWPLFEFAAEMGIAVPISPDMRCRDTVFGGEVVDELKCAEDEESMRCLYVASTRASDYLVLASTLKASCDLASLDEAPEWLGPYGQAVGAALARGSDVDGASEVAASSEIAPGSGAVLDRLDDADAADEVEKEIQHIVPLGPGGKSSMLVRMVPLASYAWGLGEEAAGEGQVESQAGDRPEVVPESEFRLVGPVEATPDSDDPFQVSVSALMCLDRCPRWYVYEYMLGLSRVQGSLVAPSFGVETEARLNAAQRGSVVHHVCQWVQNEKHARTLLGKQLHDVYRLRGDALSGAVEDLWPLICNYLESPEASADGRREQAFLLDLGVAVVSGIADYIAIDDDKLGTVVDLKTNRLDEEGIELATRDYRTQMDAYALAAERGLGAERVTAVLNFLHPNVRVALEYGAEELLGAEERLRQLAERAGRCSLESTEPELSRHCRVCYYSRMCWPSREDIGATESLDDWHEVEPEPGVEGDGALIDVELGEEEIE